MESVLPRHLQIIYEINRRFLEETAVAYPGDRERLKRMSLIEEATPKQVRMANLAIVGSHSINGVSAIHTRLIQTSLVPDFYQLWPERFNNKTNGITQRRWLLQANPALAELISTTIGDGWITDLSQLRALESGQPMQTSKPSFAGSSGRIRKGWPESFETAHTLKRTLTLCSIFRSSGFICTSDSYST